MQNEHVFPKNQLLNILNLLKFNFSQIHQEEYSEKSDLTQ